MNTTRLTSFGVFVLGAAWMHSANATLQTWTRIDLSAPAISIVDLNPTDGIAPVFVVTPDQSSVYVFDWGPFNLVSQHVYDWNTPLSASLSSAQPAASGEATYSGPGGIAMASLTGYVEGNTFSAGAGLRASFQLGAGTQATFAFTGSLAMSGADPYDPNHEAYAIIQAYFQNDADYNLLAYDIFRNEAWMGDLAETSRPFELTVTNSGSSDITGWLDISSLVETISRIEPTPAPEPATLALCLVGLGFMGLSRRRTWA